MTEDDHSVPADPFADFDGTVRQYSDVLVNFFVRKGVSYSDGQDLAQRTFLRIWNYRSRYAPTAKFTTFLFMIAGQVATDYYRAEGRRKKMEDGYEAELEIAPPAPHAVANGALAAERVRAAVRSLDPSFRDVVELGLFQDLPYAEVAEILGIPVGTVKSRMHYALVQLKEKLAP